MKSLIFALICFYSLLSASHASIDCYGAMLDNYSKDSNSFQIYDEVVAENFENKADSAMTQAISLLESKLDCKKGDLKIEKVSCKEIVPGNSHSKVCYAEEQRGYFFVSIDMMEQVNITFSRWD